MRGKKYTTAEVAEKFGLSTNAILGWAKKLRLNREKWAEDGRTKVGYRFTERDIETIRRKRKTLNVASGLRYYKSKTFNPTIYTN